MDCLHLDMDLDSWWDGEDNSAISWMSDIQSKAVMDAPRYQGFVTSYDCKNEVKVMDSHLKPTSPKTPMGVFDLKTPTPLESAPAQKVQKKKTVRRKRTYTTAACPMCQKVFFRKYEMMRHLKATHLQMKPFHCDLCSSSFSRKAHLKLHMIKIHNVDAELHGKGSDLPAQQEVRLTEVDQSELIPVPIEEAAEVEEPTSQFPLFDQNFSWM
mmetsp:Transcript_36888/g.147329  ORF Transcript_36888/g.147329 Transcript_36888/m.147329 type:complete len:212 (-) Transcript_36888:326-961(-)